jgi:hypothetical protein
MGFFRSEILFRTTQELEYLFFCRAKREFFFQTLTLGYIYPPFKLNGWSLTIYFV